MFPTSNIVAEGAFSTRSQFVRLILAFLLMVSSHFVFAVASVSQSAKTNAESLTQSLVSLNNRYLKANSGEQPVLLSEMLQLAAQRRLLLIDLIENNPGAVLRVALPEKLRSRMPAGVQALLERNLELDGELEVFYEDYDDGTHRLRHVLKYLDDRIELRFKLTPPGLQSGTPVNAKGVILDDIMAVASSEDILTLAADGGSSGGSNDGTPAPLPNTFGEQRTLVLLVNFQDDPDNKPWTTNQAQDMVFGMVSDFFYENSYQQTWLTGDVSGWHTIAVDSTSCNTTQIADAADFAATAVGVDLSLYTRRVYIFPYKACGWSGVGTVGGMPSLAWINGKLDLKTIGHELGHNFGLQHSHSLECGTDTLGTDCQQSEYGDHFDIMGNYTTGQFNAFQKAQLGWLDYGVSPSVTSVEISGTYTLEPYELAGEAARAVKILKEIDPITGAKSWYYLEYRQAVGFDDFLAGNDNVVNGVLSHLGTDSDRNSSQLLDMTPESDPNGWYDWEDAALEAGMTYSDPVAGLIVTTLWTDGSGAGIDVDFGTENCVHADPSLSFSPVESQWVAPGATVDYTVSVTNNDNTACSASEFNLEAASPIGWTASFNNPAPSLEPGMSMIVTLSVTSSSSAADGFYTITVSVSNNVDTRFAASDSVTYVVSADTNNQAPIAVEDSVVTAQETAVTVVVLDNDSDPDGDPLQVVSFTQGAHGQVSLNGDGSVTYLPDRKFKGDDSFSYSISDGVDTAATTVVITVERSSTNGNGGGGKGGGKPSGK